MAVMSAMWDDRVQYHRPDDTIHSLRVPSSPLVANATPSGEYDRHLMPYPCPLSLITYVSYLHSHTGS